MPGTKRPRSASRPSKKTVSRPRRSRIPRAIGFRSSDVHQYQHIAEQYLNIYPSTGFLQAGASQSLAFAVINDGVYYSVTGGGFTQWGANFSNAVALASIYQQYRIKSFSADILYSNNSSAIAGTQQLPLIYGVIDKDDAAQITSSQQILGYSNVKIMQLGNSSGAQNGHQYMKCIGPATQGVAPTVSSTTVGNTYAMVKNSPWLSTDYRNVEHNGMKFWYDNQGQTGTASIGAMTIIFKVVIEYKMVK